MQPIAANITLLYRERPLLERFAAAAESGFDGVEIQIPYEEEPDELARASRESGLPVVLINVPVPPGEFGIAGRPEMTAAFRAQLPQVVEYAHALEVRAVHVLAGRLDESGDRERYLETYVANLARAADMLAPLGIHVLIEALNPHDVPGYLVDSLDVATTVLARCPPGIGLQFDVYHLARMGLDATQALAHVRAWVRHVQFADAPGRHQPGTGRVDFAALLKGLRSAHYDGWLGAEYSPTGATETTLAWLPRFREVMSGF
jgi:hydroxypyruvate isomerase